VFLLKKIEREGLIIEAGQFARVGSHEGVHRPLRRFQPQKAARLSRREDGRARFIQSSARPHQFANALIAAERRLHRPLRRHCGAQAQGTQELEG